MDNTVSIGVLLVFAYLASQYKRQVPGAAADDPLPYKDLVDLQRWRHDGSQPTSQRVGNLFPAVKWPEVEPLLLSG